MIKHCRWALTINTAFSSTIRLVHSMLADEMLSYFTTAHSTKNPLYMKLFHDENKLYGTLMSSKFREGLTNRSMF